MMEPLISPLTTSLLEKHFYGTHSLNITTTESILAQRRKSFLFEFERENIFSQGCLMFIKRRVPTFFEILKNVI